MKTPAPPLSLYAHFPWCVRKCPYCDFNSHTRRGEIDQAGYVDALLADLDYDLAAFNPGGELVSIFLGGGTPSLFSGEAVERLLQGVGRRMAVAADCEVTLEANPGAVEHDDFAAYRAAGVNRLSIGAQSFDAGQLRQLGRIHHADDASRAVAAATAAGFDNINLDLMHGLPGQNTAAAVQDLHAALALSPAHLSLYQLTIEPNTLFHRRPPTLPDDDAVLIMQNDLRELAAAHGYRQYEISAFARPGRPCRHNLNYWQFGDYLGIGAGAHGKVTCGGGIHRYWKVKHPRQYLAHAGSVDGVGGGGQVATRDVLFEFLLNGLRLRDGVTAELIRSRTGRDISEVRDLLAPAIERGLVAADGGRISCSAKGYRLLDEILQEVLPPTDR